METIFPTDNGYAGLFLVGFRKDAGNITQRTGTVVLKRTYAINPAAGTLTPTAALTIFMQDVPDDDPAADYTLRYEHDLATFKPEGDIVVLGMTEVPPSPAAPAEVRVLVNGSEWFRNTIGADHQKAALGWEPRVGGERQGQAGNFPTDANAYPLRDPLPSDFQNLFFNGYLRTARQISQIPYLPATSQIQIVRSAGDDYGFTLRGDAASATYFFYSGSGPDQAGHWQPRSVTMNLDTLVIEPDANRCYLVWRGMWPFDEQPADAYRRLEVQAWA